MASPSAASTTARCACGGGLGRQGCLALRHKHGPPSHARTHTPQAIHPHAALCSTAIMYFDKPPKGALAGPVNADAVADDEFSMIQEAQNGVRTTRGRGSGSTCRGGMRHARRGAAAAPPLTVWAALPAPPLAACSHQFCGRHLQRCAADVCRTGERPRRPCARCALGVCTACCATPHPRAAPRARPVHAQLYNITVHWFKSGFAAGNGTASFLILDYGNDTLGWSLDLQGERERLTD